MNLDEFVRRDPCCVCGHVQPDGSSTVRHYWTEDDGTQCELRTPPFCDKCLDRYRVGLCKTGRIKA